MLKSVKKKMNELRISAVKRKQKYHFGIFLLDFSMYIGLYIQTHAHTQSSQIGLILNTYFWGLLT